MVADDTWLNEPMSCSESGAWPRATDTRAGASTARSGGIAVRSQQAHDGGASGTSDGASAGDAHGQHDSWLSSLCTCADIIPPHQPGGRPSRTQATVNVSVRRNGVIRLVYERRSLWVEVAKQKIARSPSTDLTALAEAGHKQSGSRRSAPSRRVCSRGTPRTNASRERSSYRTD